MYSISILQPQPSILLPEWSRLDWQIPQQGKDRHNPLASWLSEKQQGETWPISSLGDNSDLDPKHPSLFPGRHPFQAKLPTGKLHRQLHFNLNKTELLLLFKHFLFYAAMQSKEIKHKRGTEAVLTSVFHTYSVHRDDCALPIFVLQCLWLQLKNMEVTHELGTDFREIS